MQLPQHHIHVCSNTGLPFFDQLNVVRMPKVAYFQAADLLLRAQSDRGEQEAGQGDEEQEEEDLQPGAH